MVIWKPEGLKKIKAIIAGDLTVNIPIGSYKEGIDELEVVLNKLQFVGEKNFMELLGKTTSTSIQLGKGKTKVATVLIPQLFEYFGITPVALDEAKIITRGNGLVYNAALGEVLEYSADEKMVFSNDGHVYNSRNIQTGYNYNLRKDVFKHYMPDLNARRIESKKNFNMKLKEFGLGTLAKGTQVRIKTFAELSERYGSEFSFLDSNKKPVFSSEQPESGDFIQFIRPLRYVKTSGDYYDGKVATVVSTNPEDGSIILDIGGATEHNKFIDAEGKESSSRDALVKFTPEFIELI